MIVNQVTMVTAPSDSKNSFIHLFFTDYKGTSILTYELPWIIWDPMVKQCCSNPDVLFKPLNPRRILEDSTLLLISLKDWIKEQWKITYDFTKEKKEIHLAVSHLLTCLASIGTENKVENTEMTH